MKIETLSRVSDSEKACVSFMQCGHEMLHSEPSDL